MPNYNKTHKTKVSELENDAGYVTDDYVDSEISSALSSVYTVKGSKTNYSDLPSSGNKKGDVWNVVNANGNTPAGTNYVWNGSAWDALGGTIDLSGYATTTSVNNINSALTTHISNTNNPHSVTKSQIGLGNVDNTSDANKNVANAVNVTTNINGKAISNIFESNGTTVKSATSATTATNYSSSGTIATALAGKANSSHSHTLITIPGDNRNVSTVPTDYNTKILFAGLKTKASINNPSSDTYSYILGLRGWSDNFGGYSHEIAFNNTGVFLRKEVSSPANTWGSWNQICYVGHNHDSVYLGKTATATNSSKLNGQEASYYLNYNNLSNKPLIGNGTITINQDGTQKAQFTLNQSGNTVVNLTDNNTVYTHPSSHPASMITGLSTVATSGSYDDLSNKPSIPTAYTHPTYTSKSSGLYKITVDGTGHISATTAVEKSDITALGIPGSDTNTHFTTGITAGATGTTSNSSTTNGNTYIKIKDDSTHRSQIKISGSGATSVSSDANGNITISSSNTTYSVATTSSNGLMSSGDKTKLDGIASGATANIGTITGITMNGSSKGTSGVVNLGTVLTAHQDISTKENISNKVTSFSSTLSDTKYPSEKLVKNSLDNKVDKVSGKGLSTNDLTGTLKSNYDVAYTHSTSTHAPTNAQKNSDITKAEIEAKLTGTITTHSHNYSSTDTKNTAGSTDTSSKIFLIGATQQAANPQTYSQDTAYVGTDGCLYSNSTKVSVEGHTHSQYLTSNAVTSVAGKTGAVTLSKSDVGLGSVGNFKAVSTVASQGLTETEKSNARNNIGAAKMEISGSTLTITL